MDIISKKKIIAADDFNSIENMKNPVEIVSEIKYESENFSLSAMYAKSPIYLMCDGAAVIITENQLYAAYLESRRKTKTPHGHGPTFSKMQFLFYSLDEILEKYNKGEELRNPNFVYIEFSTDTYSNIELPRKINEFQYEIIKEIADFYEKMQLNPPKMFYEGESGKKIEVSGNIFDAFISNFDGSDSVFLTESIEYLKNYVNSNNKHM